jgi:hypothetical protein
MYRILAILMLLAVTCFVGVIGDTDNSTSYQDKEYLGSISNTNICLDHQSKELGNIIDNKLITDTIIYCYNTLSIIDPN